MTTNRLYKAAWVERPDVPELEEWELELLEVTGHAWEPEGWREYALEQWPDGPREGEHWPNGYKPFFWPNTDKVFRSRSAAQYRVDIINRWGGKAVLVECTPVWEWVEVANARRRADRYQDQIDRKRAEIDRKRAEIEALTDKQAGAWLIAALGVTA